MLNGITTMPKPCLKKVLIEKAVQPKHKQSGFIDLYIEKSPGSEPDIAPQSNRLKLTFDFNIKIKYPITSWATLKEEEFLENKNKEFLAFQKQTKTVLSGLLLVIKKFTDKNEFLSFVASSETKKQQLLKYLPPGSTDLGWSVPDWPSWAWHTPITVNGHLSDYTYYDNGIPSVPYINIPKQAHLIHTPPSGESSDKNPTFLAYVYFLHTGNTWTGSWTHKINPIRNTIGSEIIFDGGAIPTQTGFFTISDVFSYKGKEHTLFETTAFSNALDKDPNTGYPMGATKPTQLVEQVNMLYGAPGDIWMGSMHMHKVVKSGDPNLGKYRAMVGTAHDPNKPHPFLDYNIKSNDKIVDFRSVSKIENMFVYNSDIYTKLLASTSEVLWTGGKKKNTIDELVNNKGIVSEANYSIRPTINPTAVQDSVMDSPRPKDNIHFIFAIDKMALLKETTSLPGLLDKLTFLKSSFGDEFVNRIDIFHFEIIRLNKTTGMSKTLIVGNNDLGFDDYGATDYLDNNISKGFRLQNVTNNIKVDNIRSISFYEFTDGEIDALEYENNTYTYKIVLQFRDPLVKYLTERLNQVRRVIKDLDELSLNTELKIKDNSRQKFVNVFDNFQQRMNPQFVKETLTNDPLAQLPFTFGFSAAQVPNSIEEAFPVASSGLPYLKLDTLTYLLVSLSSYEELEPKDNFSPDFADLGTFYATIMYIRHSLKLSSTSPTLIQKVRSLLFLMEDRFTRSLQLYTSENITKKESGFTYTDYIKGTNVKNAGEYVIKFDYTFNNFIDLSKTKNYTDWIKGAGQVSAGGGIKIITTQAYADLVTVNRDTLLSENGKDAVGKADNFSYSFLPIMGASVNLFNNASGILDFEIIDFQRVRKRLFDRITNSRLPVLIPEVLSFFGIRFLVSDETIDTMLKEKLGDDQQAIDFNWKDNWGEPFDPSSPQLPGLPSAGQVENISPAFGSVVNPQYEWQGDSIHNYPILIAKALINVLTTDNQYKFKDIKYLRNTYGGIELGDLAQTGAGIWSNKNLPWEVNLFSTSDVTYSYKTNPPFMNSFADPPWLNWMFADDGTLNYYNYYVYCMMLSLFGRVHYLKGFDRGAVSGKLTPTSYTNRNLIKSMNWGPITKAVLDQLTLGEQLLCKVQLFEGEDRHSALLDQRVVNLFKNQYNYNKYFFIGKRLGVLTPTLWESRDDGDRAAPVANAPLIGYETLKLYLAKVELEREPSPFEIEKMWKILRFFPAGPVEGAPTPSKEGSHQHLDAGSGGTAPGPPSPLNDPLLLPLVEGLKLPEKLKGEFATRRAIIKMLNYDAAPVTGPTEDPTLP
mgnify:CR=1 FL=1